MTTVFGLNFHCWMFVCSRCRIRCEPWAALSSLCLTVRNCICIVSCRNATTRGTRKVSTPGSVFLHYEAYSWAGKIIQTKTFLFHYCLTQPKYRQLKTAQIYNVNFKATWWIFFKSNNDIMLNLINDFRFISVLQWYLKVLRPFEVLLLCQKLLISLIELVNVYRHDRFRNPSSPRRARGALFSVRFLM